MRGAGLQTDIALDCAMLQVVTNAGYWPKAEELFDRMVAEGAPVDPVRKFGGISADIPSICSAPSHPPRRWLPHRGPASRWLCLSLVRESDDALGVQHIPGSYGRSRKARPVSAFFVTFGRPACCRLLRRTPPLTRAAH